MGNFIPIFIEERNIQYGLQLLVAVIPDVGLRSAGFQEVIPLLPDPDRMRFDPRQVLQVFYGEGVHHCYYKENGFFV
jgi:hypothetical protein